MSKILVTGACGHIGTNITNEAIKRGHTVVGMDNLHREAVVDNLHWLQKTHGDKFQFIWGDVRSRDDFDRLPKVDAVIHMAGQCFDKDTEFLSPDGWKKISEYKDGLVAQYEEDGTASFVKPERYIVMDSEGLFHFESPNGLDQCLSLEHKFVYLDGKNHLQKKLFKEVVEEHENHKDGFRGRVITSFTFKGHKFIGLSDDQIRLQVAVIADGWFQSDTNWVEVGIKKQRKIDRLKHLLEKCSIKYDLTVKKNGVHRFRFNSPWRTKKYDFRFYSCSQEQLQIICDEVLLWDGDQHKQFSTNEKESADFIQFAFSATGKRATICRDERINRNTNYRVCITSKNKLSLAGRKDKKIVIEKYVPLDGKQYCFTVPSGMLVMRRNNKIFISGNCGVPWSTMWPQYDFETNAGGTLNALEFARKCGNVPFVYASTNKTFSDVINTLPVKESPTRYEWDFISKVNSWDNPLIPGVDFDKNSMPEAINHNFPITGFGKYGHSLYGISKLTGDLYVQEYHCQYGLPTAINKMSCIYGLFQKGVVEQGWVSWFINQLQHGDKKITYYGTGKQVRDVLDARDVARLYVDEVEDLSGDFKCNGEIFTVGGGPENTKSLIEAVEEIEKQLGVKATISYEAKRPADQDIYISSLKRVKEVLGWEPVIKFEQTVADMIEENR